MDTVGVSGDKVKREGIYRVEKLYLYKGEFT